jgi:hypothetical protein
MNSETELQTLDLLTKPEVIIRCRHYRGLSSLNRRIEQLERFVTNLKPSLPLCAAWFLVMGFCGVSVPYLYNQNPDQVIFAFAVFFMLTSAILALSTISKESTIKIDSSSISFTGPIVRTITRANFKWTELKHLVFAENGTPSQTPNQLFFSFGLDGVAEVEMNALSRSDLRDILLSISLFGSHVEIKPTEVAEELGIKDRKTINPLEFTELWQSRLERRFAPTIFVPLEKDQKLQNGSIKVIGQVAYGGMSAIYLASHANLGTVVLKESVISGPPESETVKKAAELFKREALLLCSISHERIAKIYDYFVEDDRHYLLLEHIPGRTVRNFIANNGPVSETIAIRWGKQLAQVLQYLHCQNPPIVHRDLTPDNIIVGEDGQLSVIDFGAANIFLGTATGTIIGKASYMPPEQFKGKTSTLSDIYSLGGVLHYISTGRDPDLDLNAESESANHKLAATTPSAGRANNVASRPPTKLQAIIRDCLEPDSKARVPTATALLSRLESVRTGK